MVFLAIFAFPSAPLRAWFARDNFWVSLRALRVLCGEFPAILTSDL